MPTREEIEAAAAVRRAEKLDRRSDHSTLVDFQGKCRDCGATFPFEYGDEQHMAPCPECGSQEWHRVEK